MRFHDRFGFGVLALILLASSMTTAAPPAGLFEATSDVGVVLHPGSTSFDAEKRVYKVSGSGANMWAKEDAFHFAWKKASGDVALSADVAFLGRGTDPHRKACLMIRQSLDADSAYVDVAFHGDGLTSLQFREAAGEATHEVQSNVFAPSRLRIEKRGGYVRMYLATETGEPTFSGGAVRIAFKEPFYIGLGVCSHNKDVTERAIFTKVELTDPLPPPTAKPVLYSCLETQTMSSTDRRVVYVTPTRIEAPNWLRDGKTLIYNSGGRLYRIPAGGDPEPIVKNPPLPRGKIVPVPDDEVQRPIVSGFTSGGHFFRIIGPEDIPVAIDTGFAVRCNNDHGLSPDGTLIAISDQSQGDRKSRIYTLPVGGGTPKLVTPTGPSYWHGWSPDGKTMAFCGERDGEFDVYTIPAAGGPETRLTTAKGLDDGPEYSPDGKSIYFNSLRTGTMQIHRMDADGSHQEPITNDEFNNWFPHPSPDGRSLVFVSFDKDVVGHPENKDVTLRRMTLETKTIDVLGRFFGGQGTVNVPCWSPDGRKIAFVNYQHVP